MSRPEKPKQTFVYREEKVDDGIMITVKLTCHKDIAVDDGIMITVKLTCHKDIGAAEYSEIFFES